MPDDEIEKQQLLKGSYLSQLAGSVPEFGNLSLQRSYTPLRALPFTLDLDDTTLMYRAGPVNTLNFVVKSKQMNIEWLNVFPKTVTVYVYEYMAILEDREIREAAIDLAGLEQAEAVAKWFSSLQFNVLNGLRKLAPK